ADLHAGPLGFEPPTDGREPAVAQVALGGDAQRPPVTDAILSQLGLDGVELGQDPSSGLEQPRSLRRQRHAPAGAPEERRAEPLLQLPQPVTDGGLRDMELFGRAGDRAGSRDGIDDLKVADLQDPAYMNRAHVDQYEY